MKLSILSKKQKVGLGFLAIIAGLLLWPDYPAQPKANGNTALLLIDAHSPLQQRLWSLRATNALILGQQEHLSTMLGWCMAELSKPESSREACNYYDSHIETTETQNLVNATKTTEHYIAVLEAQPSDLTRNSHLDALKKQYERMKRSATNATTHSLLP